MEKIIEGMLNSDHPEELKLAVFERIVQSASNITEGGSVESILESCTRTILLPNGDSKHDVVMIKRILNTFVRVHSRVAENFFAGKLEEITATISLSKENYDHHRKCFYELLSHVLSILRTTGNCVASKKILDRLVHCFLKESSVDLCAIISEVAVRNWNVDAINTEPKKVISKTINLLRSFTLKVDISSVKSPVAEITQRVSNVNVISSFFSKILAVDKRLVYFALGEIFNVLTNEEKPTSITLAPLLAAIPQEYAENIADTICSDANITERHVELALCKLIDWLAWPSSQNLDLWIITVCQKLLDGGKKCQLVAKVIEKKAVVVFNHMFSKESREAALSVFSYMMLIYQHSVEVFQKVVPRIPALFTMIEKDKEDPKSQTSLETLAELIYTLIYMFPKSQNIYANILSILKKYPEPTEADKKRWILKSSIVVHSAVVNQNISEVPRKQVRGKTGLTNLGNTCFMNSVIQALFMLRSFRSRLLSIPLSETNAPLTYNLSKLFALLMFSERSAISPNDFYKISRPSWFRVGAQQDCSEFLKYLIERIEQEEKARNSQSAESTIHGMFTGECRVDVKCQNCNVVSSRFEAFNDIPLAFSDNIEEEKRTYSLKGGDISSGRLNSRVKGSEGLTTSDAKEALESSTLHSISQTQVAASSTPVTGNNVSASSVQRRGRSFSLQELFDSYLSTESLHGQNQYRCDNCSGLQDAERRHLITTCPKFLVLTLKRFTYDIKTHRRGKIMQNVRFPNEITVPVLAPSKEDACRETTNEQMDVDEEDLTDIGQPANRTALNPDLGYASKPVMKVNEDKSKRYSLVAVVVHAGVSSDSGHYYSYCRSKSRYQGDASQMTPLSTTPQGGLANDKVVNHLVSANVAVASSDDESSNNMNTLRETLRSSSIEANADTSATTNATEHRSTSRNTESVEYEWYLFNDSLVSNVKASEMEKIQNDHPRDTPYVFIYEEVSDDDVMADKEVIEPGLLSLVESDNKEYFKSYRNTKRPSNETSWQPKSRKWNEDDDDQSNGGSPGNCGGGFGGLDLGASRFIY